MIPVASVVELEAALGAAKAGDEIVLADGSYKVDHKITCAANGTADAPIVVRSATPFGARIEIDAVEGFYVTGASWRFEGLDVRGICTNDTSCEHAFHVVGGATGFVLRRSRLQDFSAQLKVNAAPSASGGWDMPHDGLVEYCELFDTHARDTPAPVTKLNIDTGDRWVVRGNYIHDFHKSDDVPTYGAFMKSGGKGGIFERNLVLCTKDETTEGVHVGLSFGGGGTGPAFCAPAFDAKVPCEVEHDGGTMRNNVIANCSDVGIYLNRASRSRILHNTLVRTAGIDFRFPTSSGEARGNVLGGEIRVRENAKAPTLADNLAGLTRADFDGLYVAPLAGDLRKKGDLARLLGKGAPIADVADDYCARPRSGAFDLGALQHSLGDCDTTRPVEGGVDGGHGAATGESPATGTGTAPTPAAPGDAATSEDGCACATPGLRVHRDPLAASVTLGCGLALAVARARRRRRR